MIDDKLYLLPKEWKNQTEERLVQTFTFEADSQGFDFFYEGEWERLEPISNDAYDNGFYSYMNKTYDNVFVITSATKYSIIPHFEVVAK